MKKILLFLVLSACLVFSKNAFAYSDEEELCYGQCATYKFVWQGDFCYDTFQQQCVVGKGKTIRDTIKFLKGIHDTIKSGGGVDNVFKAWFMCKPLIENCIVPQLRNCRSTCAEDPLHYAPDISVGSPYGNFVYHGVIYNDRDQTLTFKVINNGMGYAWDIGANASWGHTRIRDGQVGGGGQLFSETIPELLYAGARNGPPNTMGDYIGDFLIEETNFAKYLQGFKSDADNYDVPSVWYKTIPFTPPGGELTKVTFNVDSNQMITERSELNNSFVLVIDKLPTPPSFQIDNFSQRLEDNTLNNFLIDFDIKNTGEENGEMTVKIYEDKYNNSNSQTAIFTSSRVVQALNKFNFNTFITPDITAEGNYCGRTKKYELVVFDSKGKVDSHEFSLPLYSGSVRGRVEDLFGKEVYGATVTADSGQTTTTSKNTGSYFLKNINRLGKVTIRVTHPDFSKVETREVEFKMGNLNNPCAEGNLTLNQVNFVLQDQEVMFTISIKDGAGNLVNAHVLASNSDWRFEEDVDGEGPLPGMQPGKYVFRLSAPGYKTISQTVNAVPNQQNLEFVVEVLNGRLTDGGLTIFTAPQLLWQMDRGTEIFAKMTATKNGKEVILYTQNKALTGKLYFLDSLTGNQIKVVSNTVATGGQSQSCLDTSYDGNTTALYVHNGTAGIAKDSRNVLKLFDNQGRAIGTTDFKSGGGAHECDVSPDGFYVYPDKLLNKGLYTYTRFDIEGVENSKQAMGYPGLLHFTTGNNVVVGCPKGGGQCLQSLSDAVISNFGKIDASAKNIDSSQDTSSVVMLTTSKAYLFRNGTKAWEKDVITKGDPLSISVSPGGKFVIYSTAQEQIHGRTFKIFTDNNIDKTFFEPETDEDVIFVHANDKGIFYAVQDQKIIKYYQVGSYSVEYNPTAGAPTEAGQATTNNISYYDNGVWRGLGQVNTYQLLPGRIYMANSTVNLQVDEPWGKLTILDGTIFGTDNYLNPVLLKGQIKANFGSAFKIYAIKFDRYDLNLFADKLAQFTAGELPQSEYFLVQNIHTKFVVNNYENKFSVGVDEGEVQVLGYDVDKKVENGRQITIDGENKVRESIYLGWKVYIIGIGIVILVSSTLLYKYRQTRIGKLLIKILKNLSILAGKCFIIFIKWLGSTVIALLSWVWKMIKKLIKKK